jgi:ABC-2 type transport system ATP-binding protein
MNDNQVIVTHNLTRRFGDNAAVDGLSIRIEQGEVFGFLGHNGAGKTTTIRLLNGVLTPSDGYAWVLGFDPVADGPSLRRRTGVLTENPSLDERLTARENLHIYADLYGVPVAAVDERVDHLLEMFEIADRADDKTGGYSKGMKQRLALARALIHEPQLIYLDEPTSGLDPLAARQVRELITHLSRQEGRTVFLCTHNLVEAQRLCDRVAVLEHGRLLALGTPVELGQRLVHHQRVEIEVGPADRSRAAEVLNAFPNLAEMALEGDVVSVSGISRERIPDLIAALVGAGVRMYRVTAQEPTLEDVYFALHPDREEAA